jgi:pyrimidine operon attenuation protein/uracil phosphoribosyltransferase
LREVSAKNILFIGAVNSYIELEWPGGIWYFGRNGKVTLNKVSRFCVEGENMVQEVVIQDAGFISEAIEKIVAQILERNTDAERLAVVGIHTRGVTLAKRIRRLLEQKTKKQILLGLLDITLYRDDLDSTGHHPVVRGTQIEFNVEGKDIILVDDVLFTGRTVRAALDQIVDFGRPASIQLAVLVDRGHRELPICPDYVGARVRTRKQDVVRVRLKEDDGVEKVVRIIPEGEKRDE